MMSCASAVSCVVASAVPNGSASHKNRRRPVVRASAARTPVVCSSSDASGVVPKTRQQTTTSTPFATVKLDRLTRECDNITQRRRTRAAQGSKVLVVGSTGGVGQLVVAKLLEAGYKVRALARNPEKAAELFGASGDLEIVTADCRDASALDASGVARDVDAVVSCTGTTAFPSARWKDGNGPEQTDFIGTSNLVAAVASQSSASCKRFVLVSSIGVKRTDQMPFIILNAFGVLKYKGMGEQALMNSGLPFTILRPGRLTDGPYTSYDINTLLKATSGTRRAVDIGKGDVLLPEETSRIVVADAAVAALSCAVAEGEAYELGTKEGAGPGSDGEAWEQLFASAK